MSAPIALVHHRPFLDYDAPSMSRLRDVVLLCGATACGESGDDMACPADPPRVTLADTVYPRIIEPQCKSCHNPTGLSTGGDYSSLQSTRSVTVNAPSEYAAGGGLKVVDPKNLANSTLWLKVLGGDATGRRGPAGEKVYGAMPSGGSLTAEQKQTLKSWICGGAL